MIRRPSVLSGRVRRWAREQAGRQRQAGHRRPLRRHDRPHPAHGHGRVLRIRRAARASRAGREARHRGASIPAIGRHGGHLRGAQVRGQLGDADGGRAAPLPAGHRARAALRAVHALLRAGDAAARRGHTARRAALDRRGVPGCRGRPETARHPVADRHAIARADPQPDRAASVDRCRRDQVRRQARVEPGEARRTARRAARRHRGVPAPATRLGPVGGRRQG